MKLILSVAAIKPPLTGIGRYTWELAKRVPSLLGEDAVRFLNGTRWVTEVDSLLQQSQVKMSFRRRLLASRTAVATYSSLASVLVNLRLRRLSGYLFHGPNFYLPRYHGPAIATIHDLSIFRYPQFHPAPRVDYMRREIPKALARASFLITDSEFVRQELMELFGWPGDKVRAVPLGVGIDYRPRDAAHTMPVLEGYGLRHGRYALCVATIEPRKNIETLLTAYEGLPPGLRAQYRLVLVGDRGWRSEATHRRIEQGQREGWVCYLGFVPEAHLPSIYAGARGFVYPSYYEGFGLPVLEAMASGVPALVSNRASLPEIAQDAALITEAEDSDALTERIHALLEDEAWRGMAITRSLELAAGYSWENTALKSVEVYRHVAGES